MPIVSPCRLRSKGAYDGHSNKRSISYLTNAVYIIGATQYIYCPFLKSLVTKLTMPKFTSQILLLFSKVLHILENLLLKNFTGLKVVS